MPIPKAVRKQASSRVAEGSCASSANCETTRGDIFNVTVNSAVVKKTKHGRLILSVTAYDSGDKFYWFPLNPEEQVNVGNHLEVKGVLDGCFGKELETVFHKIKGTKKWMPDFVKMSTTKDSKKSSDKDTKSSVAPHLDLATSVSQLVEEHGIRSVLEALSKVL